MLRQILLSFMVVCFATSASVIAADKTPLTMVVMDPLAAPLSCPCVEGYAQRKYEILAEHLSLKLGRSVNVVFTESLIHAKTSGKITRVDLVIGKDSVVRHDASVIEQPVHPIARLTGKDGTTTQYGMIVVRKSDPAKSVADLKGYRVFFGPAESDEKHAAAVALLKENGVTISDKREISEACSDGACQVLDLGEGVDAAAVISSYAAPLLEGCGTIKKGDLRVVGKTDPVPFITAFVANDLPAETARQIEQELLRSGQQPQLLIALETLAGFVAIEPDAKKKN
ncbi:MAG: PhnD/SsuA/transferrin family substrate-binding protein [Planctomycetaceae bacterium]|nr:PhnD/SsuA/transferrin family substrate-binding protein [Planctomycetaceae bacterium]